MPQMKSADSGPITDSASTDSSVFELDMSRTKNNEPSCSALSEATSSSSVFSSVSADGLSGELIARGGTSSSVHLPSASNLSLIQELSSNEKIGAVGLRSELQGFLCKVTDMEEQLLSLKKKLVHKQRYISTLGGNLKRIEGQNSTLKDEVSGLKKDNEDLRNRLFKSEPSVSAQQLLAAHAKNQDRSLSPISMEREAQFGSDVDKVLQENATLKQKIMGLEQKLSETIKKLDHTRQRQEQRCKEMESLLLHATKELQNVETERNEVGRLLTEVLNKNSGAIKDESLRCQFESLLLHQKPAVTAKELMHIKDRLFAAHKQIDVLEKDFREEHEQRLTAERDLARMKAAVRDLERDCDTLRLQVQFLQEDFYREHEDKKQLQRSLRMKEKVPSPETAEPCWPRTEPFVLQRREYPAVSPYDRSPELPGARYSTRPCHQRNLYPSNLSCDGSPASGSEDNQPNTDDISKVYSV